MKTPFRLITIISVLALTSCGKTAENKTIKGNWRFDDFRLGYSEIHIGNKTIEWYTEKGLNSLILFYEVTGDSLKTYDSPNKNERNILDKCRYEVINDSTMNLIYFSKKKGERTIVLNRICEDVKTKQMLLKEGVSEADADKRIKDSFARRMKLYTNRDLNNKPVNLLPLLQKHK